jgi:hypothetical protein
MAKLSIDLMVGTIYRCKFNNGFEALGFSQEVPESGLYRLVRIMSYDELLETSLPLLNATYEAASKSTDSVKTDLNTTYLDQKFFIFEQVLDATIRYCFCEAVLDGDPIFGLSAYGKYLFTLDAGAWKDIDELNVALKYLKDELTNRYGIAFNTDGLLVIKYRDTYLTESEYAAVVALRDAAKQAPVNYAQQVALLQAQLAQKIAECNALQTSLQSLRA